jgi:hypothetical protein
MPKWLSGLVLAPRSLTLQQFMVPRLASGATTLTIRTLARPMATTGRGGLTAASSWASGRGTAGAGDMAGVADTDLAAAATDTDVADTATDAVDLQVAVDMPAVHAATLVVGLAVVHQQLAADLAAGVDTQVVDSQAMQVVAADTAAAADTGKVRSFLLK